MSEIWSNAPLRDLCSFISGSGFPEHLQGCDNGELPFYKVSDMSSLGNERFLFNANNYVSRQLARKRSWKTAPASAVVFAKVGAALLLNRRRMLSTESIIDNNMVAVVANEFTTNDWLYWQLLRVDFADFVQDGALPSINQRQLGEIPIPKVNATEALKISEILDTLDTAIHETEAIIAKLKAVKQGLLHDLLTRGIDANGELRPPQSEAPHLYKPSPLGWIPKEWDVDSVVNLTTNSVIGPFGSDLVASDYRESGVPVIFVRDVKPDCLHWKSNVFVSARKAHALAAHAVEAGDVVATKMGLPPCVAAVYPDSMPLGVVTADIVRLRPNLSRIRPGWVSSFINSPAVAKQVEQITAGVTRPKVTLRDVRELALTVPSLQEQERVLNRLTAMESQIQIEEAAAQKLLLEKSGLMNDLLTGRVRVTPLLEAAAP